MFRFARLCMEFQQGSCKRGTACKYLHICRDLLVSNRCPNGANCGRGHDFEGTILGRVPFPTEWGLDEKLRFVRECHPGICPDYNSASSCTRGSNCFELQVCEWFADNRCTGKCGRSHNLSPYRPRKRVYKHHMVFEISLKACYRHLFAFLIMPLPSFPESQIKFFPPSTATSLSSSSTASAESTARDSTKEQMQNSRVHKAAFCLN